MIRLRVLASRLYGWLAPARLDADFEDEIQTHLAMLVDDNLRRGVPPEDARRIARMTLGGLAQVKESRRAQRGLPGLDALGQDVRYGLRSMRRNPGFTMITVLTLAIGIGANTAIFSVVNAVLLRPLPYRDAGRLAMLWTDDPKHDVREEGVSYANFEDWRAMSRSFEDMAIVSRNHPVTLTGDDPPQHVEAAVVSGGFFALLGVQPEAGRTFTGEDVQTRASTIVLSHGFAQRAFAGSAAAVGRTLAVDGRPWTVVGVMPAAFQLPSADVEFWVQLTSLPAWTRIRRERFTDWGRVVGRLKPRVTLVAAQAELTVIGSRLAAAYSPPAPGAGDFAGFGVNIVPLATQITGRDLPLALWVLFGAVLFVLLIACTNVASLLLARGAARQREIAVRQALGAARTRIFRQLLTESLLLAGLAGALGLALAVGGVRALTVLGPGHAPRLEEVRIDPRVLLFTLGALMVAGVLFGFAPALRLSRATGLGGGASDTSPGGNRLRGSFVIIELALSAMLLCGAGLLIRSFLRVQAIDPGFRREHVLTMRVDAPGSAHQVAAFYQEVIARVAAVPGVEAAGVIEDVLQRRNPDYGITIEGRTTPPAEPLSADAITPGCFRALGVQIVKGRLFADRDRGGIPVAVVNETMARHVWPGEDPIGKRFRDADAPPTDSWYTVIGVVTDMRRQGLEREPIGQIFWPHFERSAPTMDLVVRTAADPLRLATAVRHAVQTLDKHTPVFAISTLEQRVDASLSPRRFESVLLGLLSSIALALAAIGLYGLMHYSVAQRTREIGIRMALGAKGGDVVRMILRQGALVAAAGLGAGLAAALLVTRLLARLLFEVTPTDPVTFALVPAVTAVIALLACCVPARRAARIDPLVALREE